ncbi:MAG TPA: ACP S-malonyltransferase [Clostridiaceae bacterium]
MGKIAFVFSGQGAQYTKMGYELYERIPESKEVFDLADKTLGFSVSKLCFEGEDELNKTENTQIAVLTVSMAALVAIEKAGIKGSISAGLSLGEYSSLIYSKALAIEDGFRLVRARGEIMSKEVPQGVGAMSAILGLSEDKVLESCTYGSQVGIVEAANFNCPGQVVIGGEKAAVTLAGEKALELGARKVISLTVSGPFHTSMLKGAADKLELELLKVKFSTPVTPYITNVTGDYVTDAICIPSLLKSQVMTAVLWEKTIRRMVEDGVDTFVELGPGRVLSGFIKKIDRKLITLNVEDIKSLENTIEVLGGESIC